MIESEYMPEKVSDISQRKVLSTNSRPQPVNLTLFYKKTIPPFWFRGVFYVILRKNGSEAGNS